MPYTLHRLCRKACKLCCEGQYVEEAIVACDPNANLYACEHEEGEDLER